MYTPATSYPSLNFFQWSTKTAPNPTLAAPLFPADTKAYFSTPPLDHTGAVITGNFLFGVKNEDSYVMTCYVPVGGVAADGLSATVVQGIRLEGTDFTTSDTSLIPAEGFSAGSAIFANISGIIQALTVGAIRGTIATNGLGFIMGDGTNSSVTISQIDGTSTKGFLRKNPTTSKVQYSNDGSSWVNIDSVSASNLVVVSSADTTPSYLENKITAGTNIVITKKNTGANESLELSTALPITIVSPATYTQAYLTGGTNAQVTYNNWLAVLDGSFRITIDGVLRNVTGINFTGVTSMNDVAAKIQTAIRALTGLTETVVWSTNKFVITSSLLTVASAITVTSAVGSGTDISGAGTSDWMDCDTGHGVVTNAVLNQAADSGKLIALRPAGTIDPLLIPTITPSMTSFISNMTLTAGENIDGSTTPQVVCKGGQKKYMKNTASPGTYDYMIMQPGINGQVQMGMATTYVRQAIQFTTPTVAAGVTLKISAITALLRIVGSPTDNIIVEILTDSTNTPGTLVTNGTSTALPYTGLQSATNASKQFLFPTPPTLLSNTKYWISYKRSGAVSDTNYYSIAHAPAGSGLNYIYNGSAWAYSSTKQFLGLISYTEDYGGLIYKADSNDNARGEVIGFTKQNVTTGNPIEIITNGIVDWPATLVTGTDYFLSSSAGEISTSTTYGTAIDQACNIVCNVGKAISTSKLLINSAFPKSSSVYPGQYISITGESVFAASYDFSIPIGFKPKKITTNLNVNGANTGIIEVSNFIGDKLSSRIGLSPLDYTVTRADTAAYNDISSQVLCLYYTLKSIDDHGITMTVTTTATLPPYLIAKITAEA